jgi:hypothetical protein
MTADEKMLRDWLALMELAQKADRADWTPAEHNMFARIELYPERFPMLVSAIALFNFNLRYADEMREALLAKLEESA